MYFSLVSLLYRKSCFRNVLMPIDVSGNCIVRKYVTVSHSASGLSVWTYPTLQQQPRCVFIAQQLFHQVLYKTGKPFQWAGKHWILRETTAAVSLYKLPKVFWEFPWSSKFKKEKISGHFSKTHLISIILLCLLPAQKIIVMFWSYSTLMWHYCWCQGHTHTPQPSCGTSLWGSVSCTNHTCNSLISWCSCSSKDMSVYHNKITYLHSRATFFEVMGWATYNKRTVLQLLLICRLGIILSNLSPSTLCHSSLWRFLTKM